MTTESKQKQRFTVEFASEAGSEQIEVVADDAERAVLEALHGRFAISVSRVPLKRNHVVSLSILVELGSIEAESAQEAGDRATDLVKDALAEALDVRRFAFSALSVLED